jgi:hypothetical protein
VSASAVNELTPARYRGLPVTVIGFAGQNLLAIAASGTPQAVAIAVLRPTRRGYRVGASESVKQSISSAAIEAARMREERDRHDMER